MASFFEDLWQSIFTPGPTPTLLVATNATFAALQVVLAALLYATFSVHFLILSALCGGLWAAINWFARELKAQQQQQEEKKRKARTPPPAPAAGVAHSSADENSETEVEGAKSSTASLRRVATRPAAAVSTEAEPVETKGELKHRAAEAVVSPSPSQGHKSGVSTEDEWEKVSENENEKDK